ncbi:MAG: hypothetical protein QNJ90_16390 [Planctomycetota bacterium]|nr:hypothetical protein [Planctomycetota bacterium]
MRTMLVVTALVVVSLAGTARANVGVFTGDGHSIELSSTKAIQMVSEDVTITPCRGRFLFDGTVPGMDRVEYDCRFVLKNLKKEKVTIQVAFPLNSQFLRPPYDAKKKTSDLIAQYGFIAQEEDRQYSVRYVAEDREKKLKTLFTWEMTFAPEQVRRLRVTYAMPMSVTLASTAKKHEDSEYGKPWYRNLEGCMLQLFGYVTKTGKSWAGPIQRARFRVYVKGFEQYIRQRPLIEGGSDEDRAMAKTRFPVWVPLPLRITSSGDWRPDGSGFLEMTQENYEPEENFRFAYYFLSFPRTVEAARRLMQKLSPKGLSAEDRQDLADILREFNGTKTGNKRIAKFLANQVWYGKKPQQTVPDAVLKAIQAK